VLPHLADLFALIASLKVTKVLYGKTSVDETTPQDVSEEVLLRACTIKALVTWHLERVSNVCRERCGGQGFLSANRFGETIAGAHAGMTAEGDNRVLIQKVAKECLEVKSERQTIAKMAMLISTMRMAVVRQLYNPGFDAGKAGLEAWLKLFRFREQYLKGQVAVAMSAAKKKGKDQLFPTWMEQKANEVQRLGIAIGERFVLSDLMAEIKACADLGTQATLTELGQLYAAHRVMHDLGWFVTEGVLTPAQGRRVRSRVEELCKTIGPKALDLVNCIGIEEHMNWAPIGNPTRWVDYNAIDKNMKGELKAENVWK